MRKLKLLMDHRNYMGIGNTHIFINFNRGNLNYLDTLHFNNVGTIHVFITTHASVNDDLKSLIRRFGRVMENGRRFSKIIIYSPPQVRDLNKLIKKFLKDDSGYELMEVDKRTHFQFIIENKYRLNIVCGYESLKIFLEGSNRKSCPIDIQFMEYPYDVSIDNDPGIFETTEMRNFPELFREKLIEAFKQKTPEKILKAAFKTDDDIWAYIMTQGEWSMKEEEKK